ncbi:LysR family transcriptional regulator [Photobacterium ganghwense]|uniref:LysR family transcriptional regulator n=1 Tax=Photobacterium ganghwense TaxID=320778 RepID=UPI00069E66BB|nr:LysR family transcriptional regulator [Photobacterium ganghwense]PSU09614.1 LysR family transcriptional regulator [Photobacterium ganghwense]QSV16860.1 LysR family transcriptional regulator [Photobacterium ganghwense]
MLNLKQLETFVWIANLGSFRQAAEHLCTTQPAISTRIANLEQALNTTLFYREGGVVSLTAKGRELLPLAEKILANTEKLKYKADSAKALSGMLRIGVSETLVHTWLPDCLKLIQQQLPDVEVELIVDATVNLRKELLARNVDIALLLGPIAEPSVINQVICDYPLYWVANPDLLTSQQAKAEDFAQWPIITYARNTAPYHEISRHFKQDEGLAVRFYSASSLSASVRLVEKGVGIASLPKEVICDQLASGHLVLLDADWQPSPLRFTVSYINAPASLLIEQAVNLVIQARDEYEQTCSG